MACEVVARMALLLLLLLWSHAVTAHDTPHYHQQEMSSSLVVNQLAIMKMMGDPSNSCSAVSLNVLEKLETQMEVDKQDLHTAIVGLMTELKNETSVGFENLKQELRSSLNVYQEEISTFRSQVQSLTDEMNATDKAQNTSIEDVKEELRSLKEVYQEEINALKVQINFLTRSILSLEEKVQNNTIVSMMKDQEFGVHQEEVSNCTSRINALTSQITTVQKDVQLHRLLTEPTGWPAPLSTCTAFTALTGPKGAISVVEEGSYGDDMNCEWQISLTAGTRILISWSFLETEYRSGCGVDYVSLMDRTRSDQLIYGQRLCGSITPPNMVVDSHRLKIVFHSDFSVTYRGFGLTYEALQE